MMSSSVRACVSHAIAIAVVVASAGALTSVLFGVLFLLAVITNAPLGSPIAAPLWILFALATSTAAALLCFLPATVSAARVARAFHLPVLMEISLAALFCLLASSVWGCLAGAGAGDVSAGLS